MVFDCTTRFDNDILNLTKRPQDGYSSVIGDITNCFDSHSFDSIYSFTVCVRSIGKSRLIKTRIPNSGRSVGSSGGFRLIFMANPTKQTITLCHIFPKRGKFAKVNTDDKELAKILNEVASEFSTGLKIVDFLFSESVKADNEQTHQERSAKFFLGKPPPSHNH